MSPASRTPEGTPIDCPICGRSSVIVPSTPPGDCVCPNCGTLLWIAARESHVKATVRAFLDELQDLIRSEDALDYTSGLVVSGLRKCMAAHGAALWVLPKRSLWRRSHPRLKRQDGLATNAAFASAVVAAAGPLIQPASSDAEPRLRLGVPMACGKKVVGVLEVEQRYIEEAQTQRGYLRFMTQVAALSLPLAMRLQNA